MSRPTILLTNDDGHAAAGLLALRLGLIDAGVHVVTVAPETERSCAGQSIVVRQPQVITRQSEPGADHPIYSCSGTPADCARVGILAEGEWDRPDLVISGINHGINLGDDVHYSGTVHAAMEAAMLGIPAIAVSQQPEGGGVPFINVSAHEFRNVRVAVDLALAVLGTVVPDRGILNVNLPHSTEAPRPVVTRLGKRYYSAPTTLVPTDEGAWACHPYGTADFPAPAHDQGPNIDYSAVLAGRTSVTPILIDPSNDQRERHEAWAHSVIDGSYAVTSAAILGRTGIA